MPQFPVMLFRVDFKSPKPVYLQVADQIKEAAASGALRPDDALPAIGGLAGELRVNRNAVARAYSELLELGIIEVRPGGKYYLREHRQRPQSPAASEDSPVEINQALTEIPALLHKILAYSFLAVFLILFYVGLALLNRIPAGWILLAAGVACLPLWRLSEGLARRLVYARRFELPRALRILKAEAPAQPNLAAFLQRVAEKTQTLLGARLELIRDHAQVSSLLRSYPGLRSARAPVTVGADLLMPLFSDVEVTGVLRLPPKPDGQEYDASERKFLAGVCEQAGISANHFRLRQERQESEYALDIQRALLPRELPQFAGLDLAGSWQPAKAVGGDYYDAFALSPSVLALAIADVSGKGMAAALLMSNFQATVKAYASAESSPSDLCARVNRVLCKTIPLGKFITFFYAVLDAESHCLTYANAGHNPPLLVSRNVPGRKLEAGGPALGVLPEGAYDEASVELLPGDRLLLFTDGITEAGDAHGQEFGEERLQRLLRECPGESAADLCAIILYEVRRFCREDFTDDATLLAIVVD